MEQIPKLDHRKIVSDQLDFYCRGDAGCQFAVRAAENSKLHKWQHIVIEHQTISEIDTVIIDAIQSPEVNQISLLFPCIKTQSDLESLLYSFEASQIFFFAPEIEYSNYRCIGLRAHVLGKSAWVSGFAPLECLPKTRQAPFTELVFRVKDKPEYVKSIQPETASDQLHVANLEIPGISRDEFRKLWGSSFVHTKEILGENPDVTSAAKTTFALPISS